jgi:hypothetical protein
VLGLSDLAFPIGVQRSGSTSMSAFIFSVLLDTCIIRFMAASIGERLALSEDLSSPIPAWLAWFCFEYGLVGGIP